MFVVSLNYLVPIEDVDAHIPAHMAWLEEHYQAGVFIASGRKVPRTGGIILARGDRAVVEQCMRKDPFIIHGLAEYQIIEFLVSKTVPGLDALKE